MRKLLGAGKCALIWAGFALAGCASNDAGSGGTGARAGSAGAGVEGGGMPAGGSSSGAGAAAGGAAAGGTSAGGAPSAGASAGAGAAGAGGAGSTGGNGGVAGGGGGGGATGECGKALLCESFDDYPGVSEIAAQQKFGPWRAALKEGANMKLDGLHARSGASALHVHIEGGATAGGRLFAEGAQPIFEGTPTHVYGRLMMYIEPNGTSVHWTFFGVNGDAESSSPVVGRNAAYIISSLPRQGVNTYSFVYGLEGQGDDGYHDCSQQSTTSMPSSWACVSWELDSVARKLRLYKDGASEAILSIDEHGKGCVPPTNVADPWYGPAVSQLFVGAWSFHPMNAPLDVWIDDLVVDTQPVSCPSQ